MNHHQVLVGVQVPDELQRGDDRELVGLVGRVVGQHAQVVDLEVRAHAVAAAPGAASSAALPASSPRGCRRRACRATRTAAACRAAGACGHRAAAVRAAPSRPSRPAAGSERLSSSRTGLQRRRHRPPTDRSPPRASGSSSSLMRRKSYVLITRLCSSSPADPPPARPACTRRTRPLERRVPRVDARVEHRPADAGGSRFEDARRGVGLHRHPRPPHARARLAVEADAPDACRPPAASTGCQAVEQIGEAFDLLRRRPIAARPRAHRPAAALALDRARDANELQEQPGIGAGNRGPAPRRVCAEAGRGVR